MIYAIICKYMQFHIGFVLSCILVWKQHLVHHNISLFLMKFQNDIKERLLPNNETSKLMFNKQVDIYFCEFSVIKIKIVFIKTYAFVE